MLFPSMKLKYLINYQLNHHKVNYFNIKCLTTNTVKQLLSILPYSYNARNS